MINKSSTVSSGTGKAPAPALIDRLLDLSPFIITSLHVLLSPYTKVEESFTLHAVHDVLAHGIVITKWDHVQFPGAVPRSFLPPVVLGLIVWPWTRLGVALGLIKTRIGVQVLAVQHLFGRGVARWLVLLSVTQFHIPYYAGRTLPNFLALPSVYLALTWIINAAEAKNAIDDRRSAQRLQAAIALLTATATVIRLELAFFVLPLALSIALSGSLSIWQVITAGAIGGFGSLALSGPLDYFLWSHALPHPDLPTFTSSWQIIWPELSAMHYNAIQGHAAEWGIMSWHYYLSNSLPKMMMVSLPLIMGGMAWIIVSAIGLMIPPRDMVQGWRKVLLRGRGVKDKARNPKVAPGTIDGLGLISTVVGMVGVLSTVGHKEWRFIVYVVPILNVLAATAATTFWTSSPPRIRPLIRLGLVCAVGVNVAATLTMTYISSQNYPGGEVWKVLEDLEAVSNRSVKIHFSPYPLSTGTSLFTFVHAALPSQPHSPLPPPVSPEWVYSKDEDPTLLTPDGAAAAGMDYVVLDSLTGRQWDGSSSAWEIARSIKGFASVDRKGWRLGIRKEEQIVIMQRTGR